MTRIIALIFLVLVPLTGSNATTGSSQTTCSAQTCDLTTAAENGDIDTVRRMLGANWSVDAKRLSDNKRPLLAAIVGKHPKIVRLLLDAGADLTKDWYLVHASMGTAEIAQLLVDAGEEVDAVFSGDTALHYSTYWGVHEVARVIVNAGADLELRNHPYGNTALHIATGQVSTSAIPYINFPGRAEIVRILVKAGADVNARDPDDLIFGGTAGYKGGHTPLHFAARVSSDYIDSAVDMVGTLLRGGADDQLRAGWENHRPRDMATNKRILKLLDNPGVFWPAKAYAIGNVSSSNVTTTARITCADDKPCRVSFDCADDDGNGFQKMVYGWPANRDPIPAGATISLSTGEMKGFVGATGNKAIDCALRSHERITAQVWSSTDTLNANTTAYRLSENGKAHIQFYVGKPNSLQFTHVRFRCLAEKGENCEDTEFKCTDDQGNSRLTIDAGTVNRLNLYTLSQLAGANHLFPKTNDAAGWYSCDVASDNPFIVHTITHSTRGGGGLSLVNTTPISME